MFIAEILTSGKAAITIRRNTLGEKEVTKGEDFTMTVDRFRELQAMNTSQLSWLATHEKVIWLRWTIDNNTPSVAQGSNHLIVDRENLISDAMTKFN